MLIDLKRNVSNKLTMLKGSKKNTFNRLLMFKDK